MDNLKSHFKTREPQETIAIIEEFFINKGFEIKYTLNINSEIDTWTCVIELWFKSHLIQASQGKGMTELYSKASGLGELYERFCNRIPWIYNHFLMKTIQENNYKKYGYYFCPEEKEITFAQIPQLLQDSLIGYTTQKNIDDYVKRICGDKIIGIPFYNIADSTDIQYIDPRLYYRGLTSNGMSAGNSLEEALNQALSEWYERYAIEQLYRYPKEKYYQINIESIQNVELKQKCQWLLQNGYDIKIYDLSYTFNVPVVCAFLTHLNHYEMHIQFGAFPIFDIALERCLTELYQTINSLKTAHNNSYIQALDVASDQWYSILEKYTSSFFKCSIMPQEIFLKTKKVNCPSPIFATGLQNNKEILDYFYQLNKFFNFDFYYCNNSMSKDMWAISLFNNKSYGFSANFYIAKNVIPLSQKQEMYSYLQAYWDWSILFRDSQASLSNFQYSFEKLHQKARNKITEHPWFSCHFASLVCHDLNLFYLDMDDKGFWNSITFFALKEHQNLDAFIDITYRRTCLSKIFKKYLTLINFKIANKYTDKEIQEIWEEMYKENISIKDIQNCENLPYIMMELRDFILEETSSEEYLKFIEAMS